jgi:pimeloyl-ACP methyl ester carboxylesterase
MRSLRRIGLGLTLLASPAVAQTPSQPDPVVPVEHRVDVGGGRHMNIVCLGHGSPTVVFDNGFGDMIMGWRKVQIPVSGFTRACAYDRAGTGYSDPSPLPMTAQNITDELHRLLRRGGVKGPVVLVGHSLGGLFVTLYADRFPSEVAGLVLVESSFAHQDAAWDEAHVAAGAQALQHLNARLETCASLARDHKLPEGDPGFCILLKTDVAAYRTYAMHTYLSPDHWESLKSEIDSFGLGRDEIDSLQEDRARRSFGDMPVIVLTAGAAVGDKEWKAGHDRLAARSTRGESLVVPNSGHFIQRDQPQAVVEAVRKVVDEARSAKR